MSLPPRESVHPSDLMAYALIDWQPSQLVRCPTCKESGLAGYSAHKLVALACQWNRLNRTFFRFSRA